jgi:hypothetical protein
LALESALIVSLLSALGCSEDEDHWRFGYRPRWWGGAGVTVVYDRDIDFSQYRTFTLQRGSEADAGALAGVEPGRRRDLELLDARTVVELRELGLSEVAAEEADLVAFGLRRTRSSTGVSWSCVDGTWTGYYQESPGDPCAWLDPANVDVERARLMVGLQDPERSEVVFAGFIRDVSDSRRRRSRQIVAAVDRIFDRYPARPGTSAPDGGLLDAGAGAPDLDAGSPQADAGLSTVDDGVPDASIGDAAAPDTGGADAGGADAGDAGDPP